MNKIRCARAFAALLGALLCVSVHAEPIPVQAAQWQRLLTREAQATFGPAVPVAVLAGQVHQESRWNPAAKSHVGALGIAQFMPATAAWLPAVAPGLGPFDPMNAQDGIRALVAYDAWLVKRNPGATPCDSWAFALSAYNGGESWLRRDQAICASVTDCDRRQWFGNVEKHTRRAPWARKENRGYPFRILKRWGPMYAAAGWGANVQCEAGVM